MRVGFISDLHYDGNVDFLGVLGYQDTRESMLEDTMEVLKENDLNYLFISGDIGTVKDTISLVERLNTGPTKVYYVPGNHDVWEYRKLKVPTKDILATYEEDPHCLLGKNLKMTDNLTVSGIFSWYDGTLETRGKGTEYYELRKQLWADSKMTYWEQSNEEIVRQRLLAAQKQLQTVGDTEIILLNHFVPLKDFIEHKQYDNHWNFGNGFMGTTALTDFIRKDDRVKYVTFGHTHKKFGEVVKGDITYLNAPVGYLHEWSVLNFKKQLQKTLLIKTF